MHGSLQESEVDETDRGTQFIGEAANEKSSFEQESTAPREMYGATQSGDVEAYKGRIEQQSRRAMRAIDCALQRMR